MRAHHPGLSDTTGVRAASALEIVVVRPRIWMLERAPRCPTLRSDNSTPLRYASQSSEVSMAALAERNAMSPGGSRCESCRERAPLVVV